MNIDVFKNVTTADLVAAKAVLTALTWDSCHFVGNSEMENYDFMMKYHSLMNAADLISEIISDRQGVGKGVK